MSQIYKMNSLQVFAARALRQLPTGLWWVLGLFAGAIFSIRLEKELFPHTPAVVQVADILWKLCAAMLPVLGLLWLWRLSWLIEHAGWRLLWIIGASAATVSAALLVLLLLVLLLA